jgi:bifunctional DNase/RNase
MKKPMVVWTLATDSLTDSPVVVLKEADGERMLPIWLGLLEAAAIARELQGVGHASRPMTCDLLKNIMDLMSIKVNKIEICDHKNNTYYASIYINHNGKEIPVDARPSDALALSLKVNAPIFASEEVIQKSKKIILKKKIDDRSQQGRKYEEILENLNPEDFGKYKM